jgi:DNA polymerase/3'-5' exonuclease PolX
MVMEQKTKNYEKKEPTVAPMQNKIDSRQKEVNQDHIKATAEKMNKYLKTGSNEKYEPNPTHFPEGNGELKKMDKKAYVPSGAVEDYIDNFTAAALENLDYDGIEPNEEWVTNNIEGSSKTGNNPDWANTGESDVNKKRNKIRKDNLLGKLKRKAYNKAPQPVINDKSGEDKGSDIMAKLESVNDKKTKQINEEFDRMKSLIGYNQKTQ